MTKAIRSYPENKRAAVIEHRANSNTGGLGHLAALDAKNAEIRKAIVIVKIEDKEKING